MGRVCHCLGYKKIQFMNCNLSVNMKILNAAFRHENVEIFLNEICVGCDRC